MQPPDHDISARARGDVGSASLEAAVLRTISSAFLASWSVERTSETLASVIASGMGASFAGVALYDAPTGQFSLAGASGVSPSGAWPATLPASNLLASDVLASGRTVAILDVQEQTEGRVSLARASGVRTYVAVPLRSRGVVVGVIIVGHTERRPELLARAGALEEAAVHIAQEIARRRAEDALAASELRHRELYDQVPVGLWEEDLSGVKCELDTLGADARADLPAYLRAHPDVAARCAAAARILHVNKAVLSMFGAASEQELLGNLDKVFAPESLGPFGDAVAAFHSGSQGFRVEGVNRTLQGEIRWIDLRGSFASGHEHDWSKVLVSSIDITDLKRAEAERASLEEQLHHARRMEAIGTLAGGVAHDFNNILAAIVGFGELALLQSAADAAIRNDLTQILKAAYRARDLVQQILAFSRRAIQARRLVDLHEVVSEATRLLRAATPANIDLRVTAEPQVHIVLADPTQMHQVLMNLCANGRWALRDKPSGALDIALGTAHLATPTTIGDSSLPPGDYVRLSVRDDGCGMDDDTLARIFEPYFTSKPVGEGSGLGLSVVHGIVTSHGGAIQVTSSPGAGSLFEVFLPKSADVVVPAAAPGSVELSRGAERVLFVDDEPDVAEVCSRMLEAAGYRVTTTTNPLQALDLFRARPADFDLVVTDQSLPHMTGAALIAELLAVRKDTRVILCTGYSETLDDAKALRAGARRLLMKPFEMGTLVRAVRQVLDGD